MPAFSLTLEELLGDLEFVERQLSEHPDPNDTFRSMWEQRKEALKREIAEIEPRSDNFARVALLFGGAPVAGSEEIRLDFAAKALDSYQSVLTTVVAARAGTELGARGPIPSTFSSKLFIRDMVRGSVGFLIEEAKPAQLLLVPSLLKEAVEETSKVIDALASDAQSDFDEKIRTLSPRTIGAIQKLVKVLHDAGAETTIASDETVVLNNVKTDQLYVRMTEVEYAERQEQRRGILLGLFPERRQYEFRPDDEAPVFYGPVSDALDDRYVADPTFARSILLRPVVATFSVNSTLRGGILLREERVLDALELLDR